MKTIVTDNVSYLLGSILLAGAFLLSSNTLLAASPDKKSPYDDRIDIGQSDPIKNENSGQGNTARGTMDPTTPSSADQNATENKHPHEKHIPDANKAPNDQRHHPTAGSKNLNDPATQVPVHPNEPTSGNSTKSY